MGFNSPFTHKSTRAKSCRTGVFWTVTTDFCNDLQGTVVSHCGTPELRLACFCCAAPVQLSPPPWHAAMSQSECASGVELAFHSSKSQVLVLMLLLISNPNLADPASPLFLQFSSCSNYICLLCGLFCKILKKLCYSQVWNSPTLFLIKLAFHALHVNTTPISISCKCFLSS